MEKNHGIVFLNFCGNPEKKRKKQKQHVYMYILISEK